MKKIILEAPVNNLSFGNVGYNLLRELYKKEISVSLFPIAGKLQFDSFDKIDRDFQQWVVSSAQTRFDTINKDTPCLKMWHLNNSEFRLSKRQFLYTFYELDSPTSVEKSIANLQDRTIFSSEHAARSFRLAGCENAVSIPIGFDEDFYKTDKKYVEDRTHFVLMGKFEKRKHTAKIIQLWLKKYGDNPKYQLTCCVTNPFFKPEQMQQVINSTLGGKRYFNINFLPYLPTNSEVNELLNSVDVDLTGLSGAEGWNLPSFNATCLGKWSIVLNGTAHKDWATEDNCLLVQPSGKEPAFDGVFFQEGQQFNQGSIYTFNEEEVAAKMDLAIDICKAPNVNGEALKNTFTYKNTLEKILQLME